jgi:hypothetical protein
MVAYEVFSFNSKSKHYARGIGLPARTKIEVIRSGFLSWHFGNNK